ncbi:MAG: ATP-dependent DNA helicase [Rhodospirillales bacterium]|nr:ATP-dependent DNA helicase [Rhodospirillales bacterium]USO08556.1 MAG: ATP-dependent DNA helicase [Rhodospirillales bacterium]
MTSLAVQAGHWAALTPDGEVLEGTLPAAPVLPENVPVLVCHLPYLATRTGIPPMALDILELFAFVRPAQFCVPTIGGIAAALGLKIPQSVEDAAMALPACAAELLREIKPDPALRALAVAMGASGKGWGWTLAVLAAMDEIYDPAEVTRARDALGAWERLPEWSEDAPPPQPGSKPVSGEDARAHLHDLITRRRGAGRNGETRTAQDNYATRIVPAFSPREQENQPHIVTAEAGTGVGKTLGYLAPAQLWAEENEGTVWISTYTRNLQRQIDTELETLYPDPMERARKAVIRKGRENYLCLLNYEDAAGAAPLARNPRALVAAGLMARWIGATRDGDMSGADFPGWLPGLLGYNHTLGLADRRGECIYAACSHYHRCFIERAQRRARRARLVVGNHALAMTMLARAADADAMPTRFVFDEGHHLFDAADSTFAAHLTGIEGADLRRWVLGPEDEKTHSRRSRRAKGLRKRLEGVVAGDEAATARLIEDALEAARALPGPDWHKRMGTDAPLGAIETLLHRIAHQVRARAADAASPWAIECDVRPLSPDVASAVPAALAALRALYRPLVALAQALRAKLEREYDDLSADQRGRLDALSRGLDRRAAMTVAAWIDMLDGLGQPAPENFIDWFEITRAEGRDIDVGFFRHHRDPAKPFAAEIRPHAHGVLITSATLKSARADDETAWSETDRLTGAGAMADLAPARVAVPSPFNYRDQTRVLVVRDVPKNDTALLARAYEALFRASSGGALGLFTAIHRLRAVHARLAPALESAGIPLYAQHVDRIDIGTLVDIFRAEEESCLLGTDAVRDGVDVPGRSLRLIAFDRVPWPRPDILHRERRKAMGGKAYDESITRMKLRQAYGRLIRAPADHGVFVILDGAFPTRLEDSFPDGVPVERLPLDAALDVVRNFFGKNQKNS